MTTTFIDKCFILSEVWLRYRNEPEFQDFFRFADLGMPFAYGVSQNLIVIREETVQFIETAWDWFMLGISIEDTGFENLDQIIEVAPEWEQNLADRFYGDQITFFEGEQVNWDLFKTDDTDTK